MGYYSRVVIAVTDAGLLANTLKKRALPKMFSEADSTKHGNATYWIFTGVKWYSEYPDVKEVNNFIESMEETEGALLRIGEDQDDVQEINNPYDFGVFTERYIQLPFDEIV